MAVFEISGYDELLKMLDRIDTTLSRRLLRECVTAAANVVAARARQLCPVGEHHKPGAKPLRDTIGIVVREYGDERTLAMIGPEYPAGAHGHLVKYGHRVASTGTQTQPRPFVRPAFDQTGGEQLAAMEAVCRRALEDMGGT